jgi:hypothetical protein
MTAVTVENLQPFVSLLHLPTTEISSISHRDIIKVEGLLVTTISLEEKSYKEPPINRSPTVYLSGNLHSYSPKFCDSKK